MFGPDFIPVMILKNCESELSYILAELFNISEKVLSEGLIGGSYIKECWGKVHNTLLVFLLRLVQSLKNL